MIYTKEQTKKELLSLINSYIKNKESFDKKNESEIRTKLIDPIFEILGWDVQGKEYPDEVLREETIPSKESKKKKADYTFKIQGLTKLIAEAKSIKEDINREDFIEQAVGYAFNKACSWAVLTNFVNIKIFLADEDSKFPLRNLFLDDLSKFDKIFEDLWLISKESISTGYIDEVATREGRKKYRIKVDEQLFSDINTWRELISKDIKKRYGTKYSNDDVDEIAQKIIDRLIFIRKIEDLELSEQVLRQVLRRNDKNIYNEIKHIFKKFNEDYNSKLFGESEKDEHEADKIELENGTVITVINSMYKPKGKIIEYNFAQIDSDVLGNIYEQYLGYIVKKASLSNKLKEGQAHRKEQGIYYTPTYIVDYIVKNTIGELLKDKTINPEKIRILDPACGSGSFLIKSFDFLNQYWLGAEGTNKQMQLDENGVFNRRVKIAKENIFGVDLDSKAVEIAQLNLLLKLAQNKHRLPTLRNNIKIGNSLIDDPNISNKAFSWSEGFKDVIKQGGFDIIIGNPPYVRQEEFLTIKSYLESNYTVYHSMADLFVYFFEKELNLLKEGGYFGMIVSNKWLKAGYGQKLRKFLMVYRIEQFIDFGDLPVFHDATTYPCIIIIRKTNEKNHNIRVCQVKSLDFGSLTEYIKHNSFFMNQNDLDQNNWNLQGNETAKIIDKIKQISVPLKDYVNGEVYRGVLTGLNAAFVIDEKKRTELIKQNSKSAEIIKPFLTGNEVGSYTIKSKGRYLVFTRRGIDIDNYPAIKRHLEQFREKLTPKKSPDQSAGRKPGDYQWYEIQDVIAYHKEFDKSKIIYGKITTKPRFTLDHDGYIVNDSNFFFPIVDKQLLAILNSKLGWFLIKNTCTQVRGGYQLIWKYFGNVPIVKKSSSEFDKLVDKMLLLNRRLIELKDKKTDERSKIEEDIKLINDQINNLVYEIYGISEEEIKIIEM